ncbi:MAG: NTP transferase domain-containing protein [Pseudomonadales bacterium]|nr:nucleotidyltransferase family protein [Pseudomonadales bacterium]NIX09737.1 NTP transferase domain-containing protein [Pseudomonadales bacterium]
MRAMILAAGRGERLKPLTDAVPKPMLPVAGEPLIARQLRALGEAGINRVVINLHHLGEQIASFCGRGNDFGVAIDYSREDVLLDTGGGIVKALPLLGHAPFMILNGDILTDFPFERLAAALPDWADLHLVLTPRPTHRARGDFECEAGKITGRGESYVYCGIAVLRPEVFAGRTVEPFSLQQILFDAVAAGRVSAEIWTGTWIDIGSHDQLRAANEHLKSEPG